MNLGFPPHRVGLGLLCILVCIFETTHAGIALHDLVGTASYSRSQTARRAA
ncbi:uncharacterized protein UMAG_06357 [Mycosarcoma maydis]|uniref:Uncharacterized protein n=1 Tax=Mycosarcoma maydis TaxID=5270 RepID=A0A0D1CF33_MYCMD|nr:uncharacterized protein UMAG_06357 [Ustilago maydis 521]KIS65653.1 hypothetical protein UMAG_06357 [Ustilago maydis 521]|eukprot:XP_011392652.1 hypothetical protein UMAG_06357 [Ustilago maydis 521]